MHDRDQAPLNLAGLRIQTIENGRPGSGEPDLVWRRHRIANLPDDGATDRQFVLFDGGAGDTLTTFRFGYNGRVHCRFTVAADGRAVNSWAIPEVSDRDLLALFSEHILRTVLVRRGLVSFHAASLSDGDGVVLIMGDKGRGKSTLSWALQQRGWSSVADDLTRVAEAGGGWRAFVGMRDTKLHAGSLSSLGLNSDALPPRWDDADGAGEDKRLLKPLSEPPHDARALGVSVMLVLQPRRSDECDLSHRVLSPAQAVRAILEHATIDGANPSAPPPAAVQRAIGALVQSVPVVEIALPDRLDALPSSAEALTRLVKTLRSRIAP